MWWFGGGFGHGQEDGGGDDEGDEAGEAEFGGFGEGAGDDVFDAGFEGGFGFDDADETEAEGGSAEGEFGDMEQGVGVMLGLLAHGDKDHFVHGLFTNFTNDGIGEPK